MRRGVVKRRFTRVSGRLVSFDEGSDLLPEPLRSVRMHFAEHPEPARVLDAMVGFVVAWVGTLAQQGLPAAMPVDWWVGMSPSGVEGGEWLAWAREIFFKCGLEPPYFLTLRGLATGAPTTSLQPYSYMVRFNEILMERVNDEVASIPLCHKKGARGCPWRSRGRAVVAVHVPRRNV